MTQPNQFCKIPPQNTPVLNPDGTMSIGWYKFFSDLHTVSGGKTPGHGIVRFDNQVWAAVNYTGINAVVGYVKDDVNLYTLYVYEQTTGALLGSLLLDVIPR